MVRNQEIKSFNDLIKETAAEFEGKNDYGSLIFVTARERFVILINTNSQAYYLMT